MILYLYFVIYILLSSCVIRDNELLKTQQKLSDSIGGDLSLKTTHPDVENEYYIPINFYQQRP